MLDLVLKTRSNGVSHEFPQIIVIICGSLSGISSGLLYSWTSPAIPELITSNSTNITLEEASYFTVISPISMILSAPLFSILIDKIGRKKCFLLIGVQQLLCWVLFGLAQNIWVFYSARVFVGTADAATYSTVATYVCEISQPSVRGTWGTSTAISISLGIFLINVIGAFNNIRQTAIICGILPIIQFVVLSVMPESPYYLLMKGKDQEAKETLKMLHWRIDIDEEFSKLKADVTRQISEDGTWKELFTINSNLKALLICIGIRFFQQFSGMPAFTLYTQYMFQLAGGDFSPITSAIIVTGILLLTGALTPFIVEKIGRRPLMVYSALGSGIALAIETVYFGIVHFTEFDGSKFGWLPLVGMLAYTAIWTIGVGVLPILIIGEMLSTSIKGKAIGIINCAFALNSLAVPKLFQVLIRYFDLFAPFCLFSVCSFLGAIFSFYCVIEAKQKTLEEIQQELKGYKTNTQC